MKSLPKLKRGDKVAILSPSSAAPGKWPHIYQLGLRRVREDFGLIPVEFPTTIKINSTTNERAKDLIAAFEDSSIKAVISSIGGDDQVTYIKNLPSEPFTSNPKPFFGFSDNTHFANFLWLNGVPSFYGGALFTQFAMQGEMDSFTKKYLESALFSTGEFELTPSELYNDIGLNWNDESTLNTTRTYEESDGWYWYGEGEIEGVLWGGCLESIDEMLRNDVRIPTIDQFEKIVLMLETSEEIPTPEYVFRVLRALGERGILSNIQALLVGRPKAWEFNKPHTFSEKEEYRKQQRDVIMSVVKSYGRENALVVQNMNFGHTDPQIPMPYGGRVSLNTKNRKIIAEF